MNKMRRSVGLLSVSLSVILLCTETHVAMAAEAVSGISGLIGISAEAAGTSPLTDISSVGTGVAETNPLYKDRVGGYIPVDQDRNVPVIVDDGDYEGIDIDEQAYVDAYSSVNLNDLNSGKKDEPSSPDALDPSGVSASDTVFDNIENLPPLRDQGNYETCWAFSTLGAVEGDLIADGVDTSDLDLSELHLAYYTEHFNTSVQSDPLGGTKGDTVLYDPSYDHKNYLMTGGNTIFALKALMAWAGAVNENKAPYDAAEDSLYVPDSSGLSAGQYASDVHVDGWYAYNMSSSDDRILIKDAIVRHGALAISIWANSDFHDRETNTYYDPVSTLTNHAVAIVGWDDTIPASSFTREYNGKTYTPQGPGAWLVRNSWGYDGFGYNGYFWLSYYNTSNYTSGAAGNAAYAVDATPAKDDYDNNYTYDGQIGCDYGWGYPGAYSAVNIFKAKSNEVLEAVAFEAFSAKVDYRVDVYTDVNPVLNYDRNDGDPNLENAVHVDTLTGSTTAKGYYNLRLNKPVLLSPGQSFAVKVTLSTDEIEKEGERKGLPKNVYIGGENDKAGAGWMKQTADAPLGEGFGYTNGWVTWRFDDGSGSMYSYCIKAYTDNRTANGLSSVSITGQSDGDTLKIGGEYYLEAHGSNDALISSVTWSSDNENVISVKERTRFSSRLEVKNEGDAGITATVKGFNSSGGPVSFSKKLNFHVRGRDVQKVTVTDASGNSKGKSETGKNVFLYAGITEGAEENNMKWSVSDSSIVSLVPSSDKMSCRVIPQALGNATVTATASNGRKGTYKISVIKPITSLTVKWGSHTEAGIDITSLEAGKYLYYALDAEVNSDSTDTEVVWSTDNSSIITIDDEYVENGIPKCRIKVCPVAGRTTITAVSPYSGVSGSFTFINYRNPVKGISVNDTSSGRVKRGETITLGAVYSPADADYGTEIEWSVNDSYRLSITESDGKTCTVKGLATGTAYVRATSKGTNIINDYKVTVWAGVDSIEIKDYTGNNAGNLKSGETKNLIGYLNSDAEAGQDMSVTWTSSDESVARVSKTGDDEIYSYATVTAYNTGTAVIKGTTAGGHTAGYTVNVSGAPVSGVSLDKSSLILEKGKTSKLTATVSPVGASVKNVKWTSSDATVASVNGDGEVTAVSKGKATVKVTTVDGGFIDTCDVTVVGTNDIFIRDESQKTSGKGETGKQILLYAGSSGSSPLNIASWNVSDSTVADITPSSDRLSCRVTPKAVGTVTITATTSGGDTADYSLRIVRPIKSLTVKLGNWTNKYSIKKNNIIGEYDIYGLNAVPDSNATDTEVIWTSDNTSIVDIESSTVEEGLPYCRIHVYPVCGKATVRAISPYSGVSGTLTFYVYENPVESVKVKEASSDDTIKIKKGSGVVLSAEYTPQNADYGTETTWEIYNQSPGEDSFSLTENPDGTCTLRGFEQGSATVRAQSADVPSVSRDYRVSVWVPVESLVVKDYNGYQSCTLEKGKNKDLIGYINDDADPDEDDLTVTWTSSDENVATVKKTSNYNSTQSYATVSALSPGTAVIFAITANGIRAAYNVTVVSKVKGISLDRSEIRLEKGSSDVISATVSPSDASDRSITFSSSDEKIVRVSSGGLVTAVDAGEAFITAKSNDGGYSAKCRVIVNITATGFRLYSSSARINKGEQLNLTAEIEPANATNKEIKWSSTDRGVVIVDNGVVTAVGGGNARINAELMGTGFSASCKITVISPVTGVKLDKSYITLKEGQSESLLATVLPADATEKTVTWSSSSETTASVCDGVVTGHKAGNAVITVETADGNYTADCNVTIENSTDPDPETVHVTGVTVSPEEASVKVGESITLVPEIIPSNASDKRVRWRSDDERTAAVNSDGTVTGISGGKAVITVTTEDGEKESTCEITVIVDVPVPELKKPSTTKDGVSTWDCVWFGSYWQDTDSDGNGIVTRNDSKEPIKWRVLDVNDKGEALLLSDRLLEVLEYNTVGVNSEFNPISITWERSTLRSFLNSYGSAYNDCSTDYGLSGFLSNAFTSEEQQAIAVSSLVNADNPFYKTCGGNDTKDRVFCLSIDEAMTSEYGFVKNEFLDLDIPATAEDPSRVAKNTYYVEDKQGYHAKPGGSADHWWLRSPGYNGDSAASVIMYGNVNPYNLYVAAKDVPVRPALRLTLSASSLWTYAGTVNSEGTVVKPVHVSGVVINEKAPKIKMGEKIALTCSISPSDASNRNVFWKSGNPDIAEVDQTGTVTGMNPGEAVITVTTEDGGKTASVKVTVTGEEPDDEGFDLEQNHVSLNMIPGEVRRLNVSDSGRFFYGIGWNFENNPEPKGCVTMKNGVVTAKKDGTARVRAVYGKSSAVFDITVSSKADGEDPVSSPIMDGKKKYKISAPKTVNLTAGGSKRVNVSIPAQLRDLSNVINCKVINEELIEAPAAPDRSKPAKAAFTLKSSGMAGATYIRWSMKDEHGESTAYTKVIIKKPADLVSVDETQKSLVLGVGEGERLIVTSACDNTDPKDVSFSVRGKGVKVSKSGYVTAVSPGCSAWVIIKLGKADPVRVAVNGKEKEGEYLALKNSFITVKRPKEGKPPKTSPIVAFTSKKAKDKPEIEYTFAGYHEGISIVKGAGGKDLVSVDSVTKPGSYLITAKSPTDNLNTAVFEIIVK